MHCQEHQSLLGLKFKTQGRRRASFPIPSERRRVFGDGVWMERDDEHPSLCGTAAGALLGVFPRYACRHTAIGLGRSPLNIAQPLIAVQGRYGRSRCGEEGFR